jgi:hypothetical protein
VDRGDEKRCRSLNSRLAEGKIDNIPVSYDEFGPFIIATNEEVLSGH